MSSGPWKRHKYFKKIGEGANAVYKYVKDNTAGRLTGDYYDEKAEEYDKEGRHNREMQYMIGDSAMKSAMESHKIKSTDSRAGYERWKANDRYIDNALEKHARYADKAFDAEKNARDARKKAENSIGEKITGKRAKANMERYAKNEYKGDESRYADEKRKYDKTIAGRVEKAKKKFYSEPKITVTDTKTGKTRTPNKNAHDLFNIRRKKYLKHDDLSPVENGQAIIDDILGR